MRAVYLDHAATTPVRLEAADAIQPYLSERFGNPSSIHTWGREARAALDEARDWIATAIHADFGEIYFTCSGTEADNLAVIGTMLAAPPDRRRLVVSSIEHHAVLHSARFLESLGFDVVRVAVDREGLIDPDALAESLQIPTSLVSIQHANNEIGTIQDIARLCRIAHEAGSLFHTDAVQTFGALPIHVGGLGCDLLTISSHKIYGPKGAGALYIRSGVKVSPIVVGGSQEREKRAGTESVPAIVGFGVAARLAVEEREEEAARMTGLRDRFIQALESAIAGLTLNGPRDHRLPNNVNVSVEGVDGAGLLMNLDRAGIAASSGAACSSGSIEPSHVLLALGLPPDRAGGGIRFTLGRSTTSDDIEYTAKVVSDIVSRLRQ